MSLLENDKESLARQLQTDAPWQGLLEVNYDGRETKENSLAMAQLLDSRPGSLPQNWHADNASGGVTVIIPLVDVTHENGPTALQLGSHRYNESWPNGFIKAFRSPTRLAYPQIRKGDILVYSSRIIHRGEANYSSASRPILVFRYDEPALPAPGVGLMGSQFVAFMGWVLNNE